MTSGGLNSDVISAVIPVVPFALSGGKLDTLHETGQAVSFGLKHRSLRRGHARGQGCRIRRLALSEEFIGLEGESVC